MKQLNRHELTLDDLQEQHREYAEVIGVDNLLKLSDNFGGTKIYIPKRKELEKNKIYNMIYEEFDGSNISELTKKYDVCEATVYKIISDKLEEAREKRRRERQNLPGQMSLIDFLK
ncbi:MAG: hypothetical protein NC416_04445 [Eubacterium sp.]|nr:hypothetical protein [Eubacterium sp.]